MTIASDVPYQSVYHHRWRRTVSSIVKTTASCYMHPLEILSRSGTDSTRSASSLTDRFKVTALAGDGSAQVNRDSVKLCYMTARIDCPVGP